MKSYTSLYRSCGLCPRECRIDRTAGKTGFCGKGAELEIAFAGIHRGEEPPISICSDQLRGSGTIFFTGCPMGCSFCQNFQLSCGETGRQVSVDEFVRICLALEMAGAANINLVTGTHFIPSIRKGLELAREKGLGIPVVWNTSSYESLEGLECISPVVDIFLADIKTMENKVSRSFSSVSDYPVNAVETLNTMMSTHQLHFDQEEYLDRGVIVRHLVLPGQIDASLKVLEYFGRHWNERAVLSLMIQYVDTGQVGADKRHFPADPDPVSEAEYDMLLDTLDRVGITEGFIQELGENDDDSWVPDFTRSNPFPESYCDPVWHYLTGFTVQDR